MVKIKQAVFDAGPFIHLQEIKQFSLLDLFTKIFTTKEIVYECRNITREIKQIKHIVIKQLNGKGKDMTKYLMEKYNLHLGESSGIALCNQESIKLFFTDDLEARSIAKNLGFAPHGTLAIILRSLRESLLTKKESKELIESLYTTTSLFLTKDLKEWTIKQIEEFKI